MSKFVLDCSSISEIGDSLANIGNQMNEMESVISGYNVSEATEFNFSGALKAISSNVADSGEKIINTQKLINTVVETHSSLQSSLVFSPQTSSNGENNSAPAISQKSTYTVNSGDTLSKIASSNGVTLEALLAANNIENKNLIHVGDKINIPNKLTNESPVKETAQTEQKISSESPEIDISNGNTISIPNGLGKSHSYMGWQLITAKSSPQYKLKSATGMNFDSEGFGKVGDRYVVATTTTFGKVGDYVDFKQSDGTTLKCIIGDIKNQNDSGCNKWGHDNGQTMIEFVVDKSSWYNCGHSNPGTSKCHPEWNQSITSATNYGNYFDGKTA